MVQPKDTQRVVDSIERALSATWNDSRRDVLALCLEHSLDYAALPESKKTEALVALVHIEIELRRKLGQSPSVAEYSTRFPQLRRETIVDLISLPSTKPTAADPLRVLNWRTPDERPTDQHMS